MTAARYLPEFRIRRGRGDTNTFKCQRITPHRVIVPRSENNTPISDSIIKPASIKQAFTGKTAVVRGPDDPLLVRMSLSPPPNLGHDLLNRLTGTNSRTLCFQATQERVSAPITKARHEESDMEINRLHRTRRLTLHTVRLLPCCVTKRAHSTVSHKKCIARRSAIPPPDNTTGKKSCCHVYTPSAENHFYATVAITQRGHVRTKLRS